MSKAQSAESWVCQTAKLGRPGILSPARHRGREPTRGWGGIVTEPQVAPPRRLGRAFQRDPLERVAGVRGRGGQSSLLRAALGSVPMSSFKNVLVCKKRSRNTGLGSRTRPRHKCEVAEDRAGGTGRASEEGFGGRGLPSSPPQRLAGGGHSVSGSLGAPGGRVWLYGGPGVWRLWRGVGGLYSAPASRWPPSSPLGGQTPSPALGPLAAVLPVGPALRTAGCCPRAIAGHAPSSLQGPSWGGALCGGPTLHIRRSGRTQNQHTKIDCISIH